MILEKLGPMAVNPEPLQLAELPKPEPGADELLIAVSVCGVCHTELDEIEGRTPPPKLPVVPGHEIVGRVAAIGSGVTEYSVGDRVGVGWIHSSSGSDDENLSTEFRATGRDANGGYAEYMVVGERYAHAIPRVFSDEEAAPLLCAGAVGYRALRLCGLQNGQALGLTGFGGSGHLVLQLARHLYPATPIYVFARSAVEREFAMQLGADWSGDTGDAPPAAPQAIIDTTPAWRPVIAALECLAPGGRLVINAIRKEDGDRHWLGEIDYERHLWREKELKTVANVTANDVRELMSVAAEIPLRAAVDVYALEQANSALQSLSEGKIRGAKVLKIN